MRTLNRAGSSRPRRTTPVSYDEVAAFERGHGTGEKMAIERILQMVGGSNEPVMWQLA